MPKIILLVEDNGDDEKLAVDAIKSNSIPTAVTVMRDGAEAADFLFPAATAARVGAAPVPALILLDLSLPKLNGHDLLLRIRADARTRRIPVVIFSNSDDERDLRESYDSGVNSYVSKPTNAVAFSEAVRTITSYWLATNKPAPL